jgi:4-carboxymuconolactone decarboxylase
MRRFAVVACGLVAGPVRRAVRAARDRGVRRRGLEEIALMLVLYAGHPAALEALRALNQAWPERASRAHEASAGNWRRRGAELCRRVYGPAFPRLLGAVRSLHPHLARWMIEQGYGRVLSRPGLTARERGLITVAVLAAIGRERQLVSHLIGARRLGATPRELRGAWALGFRAARGGARAASARAWRRAARVDRSPTGS